MGNWDVIVPQEATNLIRNTSFELATTTGWTATASSTLTASTDYAFNGLRSMKVVTTVATKGAYYLTDDALISGTNYVFSIYLTGSGTFRLSFQSTAPAVLDSVTVPGLGLGTWQRIEVPRTENSAVARRLYIEKTDGAGTFYVDMAQLESGVTVATTPFNGDSKDCIWTGFPHQSTAIRPVTAPGGVIYDIETSFGVTIQGQFNTGITGIDNYAVPVGLGDGAFYQRTTAKPRVFTLRLWMAPDGVGALLSQRRSLDEVFYPGAPFQLRYRGGDQNYLINAIYDSGLELNPQNGGHEVVNLRLLANDPYWYAEKDSAATGAFKVILSASYVARKNRTGVWTALGTFNGRALCACIDGNGKLTVGGTFTTIAGNTRNRVARYDDATGTWASIGTGFNGNVNALAVRPDGTILAGGAFTQTGAAATCGYYAKFAPGDSDWSAASPAGTVNADVYAILVHPNGRTYIGGNFTTINGSTNRRIASHDGTSWATVSSGLNSIVYTLILASDGYIYAGGSFTQDGGSSGTYTRVARTLGNVGFSDLAMVGTGISDTVQKLAETADGRIYAAGLTQKLQVWDGTVWSQVTGSASSCYTVTVDAVGKLWVGSGGTEPIQIWNGSFFVTLGEAQTNNEIIGLVPDNVGGMFVIGDLNSSTLTINTPGNTTITNNGLSPVYPRFVFTGPGLVSRIRNVTTGIDVHLSLQTYTNERVIVDFRPDRIAAFSSLRGDVSNAISAGGKVADFVLKPGANIIAVSMDMKGGISTAATLADIIWTERAIAIDGSKA